LRGGEALIILPPFASASQPALGAHLLQACAREVGRRVDVLYANLGFAALIGDRIYEMLCYNAPLASQFGERLFASSAFGTPPFGRNPEWFWANYDRLRRRTDEFGLDVEPDELRRLEAKVAGWVDAVAEAIAQRRYRVVGCSSTFQQTVASIALLNRIKRLCPETVTIIGGANCEGPMAEGMASIDAAIDHVFSGESEASFPDFLTRVLAGARPSDRIIRGNAVRNMDAIPTPRYDEFFEQHAQLMPSGTPPEDLWLAYETSRGCWWGQKQHCTFCGLNGQTMAFREKTPDRVIVELKQLLAGSPTRKVTLSDNIMPHSYFRTLLPRLADEVPGLAMYYEEKANLSLDKVVLLKKAGVAEIQPGIEALSSPLLRRIKKGVSAAQNIALLRYARSAHVYVSWNLMYAFPGDLLEDYAALPALFPMLRHLQPPTGVWSLRLDRFSPYYERAAEYGLTNLRPIEAYAEIFPPETDLEKLAYYFTADYPSESRETVDVMRKVAREVQAWRDAWRGRKFGAPQLDVQRLSEDVYVLRDERGLPGTREFQILNREEAALALVGRPFARTPGIEWALERKLGLELEGQYVPLATADPALLGEFELFSTEHRREVPRDLLPVVA
jgi:ribosomal peptide maturation radical SAM protein 1